MIQKTLLLLGFLLAAGAALAADNAGPATSGLPAIDNKNFGPWSLTCASNSKPRRCAISQILARDPGGQQTLMGTSLHYEGTLKSPVLYIRLPYNTEPTSVSLHFPNGATFILPVAECSVQACTYAAELSAPGEKQMRAGKIALVYFKFKNQPKEYQAPINLQDFGTALDALAKNRAAK